MKLQTMALAAALALGAPAAAWAQSVKVEMVTNQGAIQLELDAAKAPRSVANFVQYAKSGHYNGTIFHRVIDGFMIQGGGFDRDMKQKPTQPPIPIESQNGLKNDVGTIAMARTSDPNSATAQFFINVVNNEMLNHPKPDGHGYAVFGKVTGGMDVVNKSVKVKTGNAGMHQNVPATPIVIERVRVLDK